MENYQLPLHNPNIQFLLTLSLSVSLCSIEWLLIVERKRDRETRKLMEMLTSLPRNFAVISPILLGGIINSAIVTQWIMLWNNLPPVFRARGEWRDLFSPLVSIFTHLGWNDLLTRKKCFWTSQEFKFYPENWTRWQYKTLFTIQCM